MGDRITHDASPFVKHSWRIGLSFGLTSGVITTLGLMVGLHTGTHSRLAVLGGILTVAIADALSDALGIHIAEESKNSHTARHIWESTIATFLAKFVIAMSFSLPVFWLPLDAAVTVSILWGLALLTVLSFFVAKAQRIRPWTVISEHLFIAIAVIVVTYYLGEWIHEAFG
jgi:VIT1/CCC1 family predicted Fe2+/Mn2+ transporter